MTVRIGTCRELADNQQATDRLSELFLLHEQAASPLSILLPWVPGLGRKKAAATRALFTLLSHYVNLRRKSNIQCSDALDMLIADGLDDATTIAVSHIGIWIWLSNINQFQYTLGIIFAGVINTGMSGM